MLGAVPAGDLLQMCHAQISNGAGCLCSYREVCLGGSPVCYLSCYLLNVCKLDKRKETHTSFPFYSEFAGLFLLSHIFALRPCLHDAFFLKFPTVGTTGRSDLTAGNCENVKGKTDRPRIMWMRLAGGLIACQHSSLPSRDLQMAPARCVLILSVFCTMNNKRGRPRISEDLSETYKTKMVHFSLGQNFGSISPLVPPPDWNVFDLISYTACSK